MRVLFLLIIVASGVLSGWGSARAQSKESLFWMKIKALDRNERTALVNRGIAIDAVREGFVVSIGTQTQRDDLAREGRLLTSFQLDPATEGFPSGDEAFHDYDELKTELEALASAHPEFVHLDSIGTSVEKREIWRVRFGRDLSNAAEKPGILFMGGHHAREHLSIEVPLLLIRYLAENYAKGDPEIVRLIDGRDIHVVPMVNPDGAEFDIATGKYQWWRKNRSHNPDGTRGVDLNRNYSFHWGTGGSSKTPSSDVYMGPNAFSEPETQAIKNLVESNSHISTLLTFHTFAEMILYPWGHKSGKIDDERDRKTFEALAAKMAEWNKYSPQASSEMYVASGDTVDWAYGEHKIFGFTFELDPSDIWDGGFYPGASVIQSVFEKNVRPCLYLIEMADNPYRASEPEPAAYGLETMKWTRRIQKQ